MLQPYHEAPLRKIAASWVILGLLMPRPAFAAPTTDEDTSPVAHATALNAEGQRQYDAGDHLGAAERWSRILEVLPENRTHREERVNAILITMEAYRSAYQRRASGDGTSNDPARFVRIALKRLDEYRAKYAEAYGDAEPISSDVERLGDELRRLLAEAEVPSPRQQPPAMPFLEPEQEPLPPPVEFERGRPGTGLIVGGALGLAGGLATTSMIVIGALRAKEARRDLESIRERDPVDEDAERDALARRDRADALTIGGSVLTGVLLIGGSTMLAFGIRRRIRYLAVTPALGPQYVGLSGRVRF